MVNKIPDLSPEKLAPDNINKLSDLIDHVNWLWIGIVLLVPEVQTKALSIDDLKDPRIKLTCLLVNPTGPIWWLVSRRKPTLSHISE